MASQEHRWCRGEAARLGPDSCPPGDSGTWAKELPGRRRARGLLPPPSLLLQAPIPHSTHPKGAPRDLRGCRQGLTKARGQCCHGQSGTYDSRGLATSQAGRQFLRLCPSVVRCPVTTGPEASVRGEHQPVGRRPCSRDAPAATFPVQGLRGPRSNSSVIQAPREHLQDVPPPAGHWRQQRGGMPPRNTSTDSPS